jgi:hypothetical protein
MVQASPFYGKASKDANTHLQNFLEVSSIINPKGTILGNVRLRLSHSLCLGKQRHGSTPTRMHSPHGMLVLMHSWPSTFRWAKPTPFRTGFPVFNNSRMRQSWMPRNVSRNTLQHGHTTTWESGSSSRTSSMA